MRRSVFGATTWPAVSSSARTHHTHYRTTIATHPARLSKRMGRASFRTHSCAYHVKRRNSHAKLHSYATQSQAPNAQSTNVPLSAAMAVVEIVHERGDMHTHTNTRVCVFWCVRETVHTHNAHRLTPPHIFSYARTHITRTRRCRLLHINTALVYASCGCKSEVRA